MRNRRFAFALVIIGLMLAGAGSAQASNGIFDRTWGLDVTSGDGTGFEICTIASSCKAGDDSSAPGGAINVAQGVATGGGGNVYVADQGNLRVQVFDSAGTFIRAWGRNVVATGPDDTVSGGFEICVAANGDVCQAGEAGAEGGEFGEPDDVAVDPAGNVYVADSSNVRIDKFDPSGNFLRAWGKDVVASGTDNTGGSEICIAGTDDVCQAGTGGALGGQFSGLSKIATDPTGAHLYEIDGSGFRVQEFNADGTFDRAWGKDVVSTGTDDQGTGFETCLAGTDDVCKGGAAAGSAGALTFPTGVGVAPNGDVYVTEGPSGGQRISKFTATGSFLRAWGGNVVAAGGPDDTLSGRAEICVPTQGDTCQNGSQGAQGGEFNTPYDAAVDGDGNVYVVEANQYRLQKFDASGAFEQAWGTDVITGGPTGYEVCTVAAACKGGAGGSLGGMMTNALGVAATSAGDVYEADSFNNRIQKFSDPPPPPPSGGGGAPSAAPPITPAKRHKCKKKKKHHSAASVSKKKCKKKKK
jgi:tripartite motif-containing protein 71